MKLLDLFSGIGGFSLAGHWLGWNTIAFCEKDKFCQKVLNKNFPGVPIFDDIKNLKGLEFYGSVNIISGGFPCQPFSVAGKRKGTNDDRYLWEEMFRIISEVKATWLLLENVPGILSIESGLVFKKILTDLEGQGYEVQPFIIPACAINAPHRRDRVWIIAYPNSVRRDRGGGGCQEAYGKMVKRNHP